MTGQHCACAARIKRSWPLLFCALLLIPWMARADEPAAQVPAGERAATIDDELLKDLGPDLDLGDAPARKAERDQDANMLDQELLKGLEDGEDLGAPPETPGARLSKEMRVVEGLIARRRADAATQELQAQILKELDDLIRQAKKPPSGGGASSSSGGGGSSGGARQQTGLRGSAGQPGKPQGATGEQPAGSPAEQSSTKTRQEKTARTDLANMHDVVRGIWGQLPQRQREQMIQSYEEQFLPKYEQMISDYFRSLAEEPSRRP